MAAKLEAYYSWAKSDTKVAGLVPWHYNTRDTHKDGIGLAQMPLSLAVAQRIGRAIVGIAKTDDISGQTLKYMTDFDSRCNNDDCDDPQARIESSFLNLYLPAVHDLCTETHGPVCPDILQRIASAYDKCE